MHASSLPIWTHSLDHWKDPHPRTPVDRLYWYTLMLVNGKRPVWYIASLLNVPVGNALRIIVQLEHAGLLSDARLQPAAFVPVPARPANVVPLARPALSRPSDPLGFVTTRAGRVFPTDENVRRALVERFPGKGWNLRNALARLVERFAPSRKVITNIHG